MLLALLAAGAVSGCTDPAERLTEFESRIPDAAVVIVYDAPVVNDIPDITGAALLAIHVAAVDVNLQSRVDITLTKVGEGATVDMTLNLLSHPAREVVGSPVVIEDVAVDNTASFTIEIASLDVPPEANPLGNAVTATDVVLTGTIRDADLSCGTVTGTATAGAVVVPLTGSTFGAKRVAAGSTGAALGDPVTVCP